MDDYFNDPYDYDEESFGSYFDDPRDELRYLDETAYTYDYYEEQRYMEEKYTEDDLDEVEDDCTKELLDYNENNFIYNENEYNIVQTQKSSNIKRKFVPVASDDFSQIKGLDFE
jgi:hypothetical protein